MTHTQQIAIVNGKRILTKEDISGLVEAGNTLNTMHEVAYYDHTSTVLGWPGYDGERDWYRLPETGWTFCLPN